MGPLQLRLRLWGLRLKHRQLALGRRDKRKKAQAAGSMGKANRLDCEVPRFRYPVEVGREEVRHQRDKRSHLERQGVCIADIVQTGLLLFYPEEEELHRELQLRG